MARGRKGKKRARKKNPALSNCPREKGKEKKKKWEEKEQGKTSWEKKKAAGLSNLFPATKKEKKNQFLKHRIE